MRHLSLTSFFLLFNFIVLSQFSSQIEITNHFNGSNIITDFDNDGDQDFIGYDENLYWFPNDGNGSFDKVRLTETWDLQNISTINSGDINNDGFPDILIYTQMDSILSCYINNGSGGIGPKIIIETNVNAASSFGLLDINNDGQLDIVRKLSSSSLAFLVYKNVGNLIFEQEEYVFSLPLNTIADMDLDGDMDLFLGAFEYFQIRYNDGFGNFNTATDFSVIASIGAPKMIDIDLDNDVDIVYTSNTSLKTIMNLGNGQFGAINSAAMGPLCFLYTMKDITYDGYPDVLVSNANISSYYQGYMINNGDGTFTSPTSFSLTSLLPMTSGNNGFFGVEDFDGNGFVDLLIGGQYLFKSTAALSFGTGQLLFDHTISAAIKLMHVNQDGIEDIVYTTNEGMSYQLGQSDGSYSSTVGLIGSLSGYQDQVTDVSVADFNLDGKDDILYKIPTLQSGYSVVRLLINNGNNLFTSIDAIAPVYLTLGIPIVVDIDNDSYPDIVYFNNGDLKWIRNLGNLTFGPAMILSTNPVLNNMLLSADMDNDNDMDIILSKQVGTGSEIFYLPISGNGIVGTPIPIVQLPSGIPFRPYTLEDLNNDGNLDLSFYRSSQGELRLQVYHGDGNNIYSFASDAVGHQPRYSVVVDINKDSILDLCVIDSQYKFNIHFQDTSGNFSDGWYCPELLEIPIYDFAVRNLNKDLMFVGGSYYGIYLSENNFHHLFRGELFVDVNSDDQNNLPDLPIPNKPVQLLPANQYYYSNLNGVFIGADILEGINQIIPPAVPYFGITTDSTQCQFVVTNLLDSTFNCDFGYSPTTIHEELKVSLIGSFPRCNTLVHYWVNVQNIGSTNPEGIIELELDSLVTFVSSALIPDSIVGQHVFWHFDSLNYFTSKYIDLMVQMPDFTNAGDSMFSYLNAYTVDELGANTSIYSDSLDQILQCAYDPNDKTVEPIGVENEGYIPLETDWLEYTVRFQNTGNDTAITVVLKDQLDSDLDWGSMELLASSHNYLVSINQEGVATFAFNFIYLTDSSTNEAASHGFIRYRIKIKENSVNGTQIHNSASIYFDHNPPIITNSTLNTLYNCSDIINYTIPNVACTGTEVIGLVDANLTNPTIEWSLDGANFQTGNEYSWYSQSAGIYTLSLSVSSDLCSFDTSVQISIIDFPIIQIDLGFQDTICQQNDPIELPIATPIGGIWSGTNVIMNEFDPSLGGTGPIEVFYTYTDSSVCSSMDSISIVVENCLLINENDGPIFMIYPNPFTSTTTIKFNDEFNQEIYINIYDLRGNVLYSQFQFIKKTHFLKLEDFKQGVYLVEIIDPITSNSWIRKLVKE